MTDSKTTEPREFLAQDQKIISDLMDENERLREANRVLKDERSRLLTALRDIKAVVSQKVVAAEAS